MPEIKRVVTWMVCIVLLVAITSGFATVTRATDGDINIPIEDLFDPTKPTEPEDPNVIDSGAWGELTWVLYTDGALKVSGTGAMPEEQAPWNEYPGRIRSVELGEGITSISAQAFHNCSRLENLQLPESLQSIGFGAFVGCSGLTQITIPAGVTSIGGAAFGVCTGLKEVELPAGIRVIEERTFAQCTGLEKIILPEGITTIKTGAFAGCNKLNKVYFYGETAQWEQITIEAENAPLLKAKRYDNADETIRGDVNGDLEVNDSDAMYLLRHTLFSSRYPLNQSGDMNGDGTVNDADAMYLLRYTLFPGRYPLK